MFNIFKRKPKYADVAFEDLSLMFFQEKEKPTYKIELIDSSKLDFTLDSLKVLDQYLEQIRTDTIPDDEITKLVLRSGAYVGEVMRKNSEVEFHWLDFKEACKVSNYIKDLGMQLGTVAILWSVPDNIGFPLAKILKYLENGSEDSTYAFAKVLLDR